MWWALAAVVLVTLAKVAFGPAERSLGVAVTVWDQSMNGARFVHDQLESVAANQLSRRSTARPPKTAARGQALGRSSVGAGPMVWSRHGDAMIGSACNA